MKFRVLKMLFAGFAILGVSPLTHAAFIVNLPDTQIQEILQNYFPVSEYAAFSRITLGEPQVHLSKKNNDIILVIPVAAKVMGEGEYRGHVTMLLGLSYKPTHGGLYLDQPRIEQFKMPGTNKKTAEDLQDIVDNMGKNALPLVRIYIVKERSLNHSLAKSELKSFVIEDGHLKLKFGFD